MTPITLNVSDELSASGRPGFPGASALMEFLATLPTPDEILALRPSEALQSRVSELLEKNRSAGMTSAEEEEWQEYEHLEHLVRMAKARALVKLKSA